MRSHRPKQLCFWKKSFLNNSVIGILSNTKSTHTWFSGRTMLSPRGVSNSYNLVNNQSFAANPPTSTTCWKYRRRFKQHLFKERHVNTDRDRFMCRFLLFKDCFDNAVYGWLKEFGNIRPKNTKIRHIRIKSKRKDSPHQLQLTKANVVALVIISSWSKFNVLRFLGFPKPKFGCLVKTKDDMIQIIKKRWITQVT